MRRNAAKPAVKYSGGSRARGHADPHARQNKPRTEAEHQAQHISRIGAWRFAGFYQAFWRKGFNPSKSSRPFRSLPRPRKIIGTKVRDSKNGA